MNRPIRRCPAMRANASRSMSRCTRLPIVFALIGACLLATPLHAGRTQKPPLHARHWIAITGKPLSAEAGAMMFQKGGNAVDAACAMLGAVTTMWDVLAWGGETQALIYHPGLKKVIGIDALGVAPTGATAEFFRSKGYGFPPEYGPLAATLRKLVEAERQALKQGKDRRQAIYAAYDRFYKGDIARELVRGVGEEGGLITLQDLAGWKVKIEEPLSTTYKGITVYKLPIWQQGPAMLQALNILENADLKGMEYNSPRYIHALYQAMNLAFADRDFYYGDPYFPPEEPVAGLLSKEYAKARAQGINWERNDPSVKPGDPYPFM